MVIHICNTKYNDNKDVQGISIATSYSISSKYIYHEWLKDVKAPRLKKLPNLLHVSVIICTQRVLSITIDSFSNITIGNYKRHVCPSPNDLLLESSLRSSIIIQSRYRAYYFR